MFCGSFYCHIVGHLPHLAVMAWTPLLFLSLDGILVGPSLAYVLLGILAVSMQILAGHPQYVFYSFVAAGIYVLLNIRRSPRRLAALACIATIYAGAAAVTAVQLLTGLDAVRQSLRSHLSMAAAASFSFPPENLMTLMMPGFFVAGGRYWGRWLLPEACLFVGAAPLSLAVFGAIRGTRRCAAPAS